MLKRVGTAVVALSMLAACSGPRPAAPAPAPTTASPTPTPAPAKPPPKPKPPAVNPLTGLRGVPTRPVIVVKVDDTASGRPQLGLEAADVVYVEQVEGGATRLAAVFASRQPGTVGPVRSVRKNDPELLGGYRRPALAYSGGAAGPVRTLHGSRVIDAGPAAHGGAYRRLTTRRAPYNLVVDTARLGRELGGGASRPVDVGLRWAAADPRLARARKVDRVEVVVGRIRVRFRWEARGRRWLLLNQDGSARRTASGQPIATPNVVVQFSRARLDPTNVDVLGTPSVYTSTVGTGKLLVLRDGRVLTGTWQRRHPIYGTHYLDAGGHRELTLRPGGAWVLLAATGAPVGYR
ncbi:MAG: DUF3048 domain-containing protein [Mycobacteriales bacterium]